MFAPTLHKQSDDRIPVLAVAEFTNSQLFMQWPKLHLSKMAPLHSSETVYCTLGKSCNCSCVVPGSCVVPDAKTGNMGSWFCVVVAGALYCKTHVYRSATPGCDPRVCCLQAARAYDAAAIVIRGPTARTNFTYPLQLLHLKSKRGKVSTTSLLDRQSSHS